MSRIEAYRDRVRRDLEAKGFPLPLLLAILPYLIPFVKALFVSCANDTNPKILLRKALESAGNDEDGRRLRKRLRKKLDGMPVIIPVEHREQLVDSLIAIGCETHPDDYVAAAEEVDFKIV